MNFAEALGYWYLRFNGFFPIPNFVLHRTGRNEKNADCDILAVRFPYVYEPVGGRPDDWDDTHFDEWGLDHHDRIVGIIAEVRTGQRRVLRAFDADRVEYALRRLGFLPSTDLGEAAQDLREHASHKGEYGGFKFTVAKLLIAEYAMDDVPPYFRIELSAAEGFIRTRMQKYRSEKHAARMFFDSELMQYFSWKL